MAKRKPMAFMSYAHFDDKYEERYLTKFCERLSGAVRLHTGEEFHIFQDRKDIEWGDSWKENIENSLDSTTFLIPIITPGFFRSDYCRSELERFLKRERDLGRNDLILPIYYIETSLLENSSLKAKDQLAQVVASRQYADWRELRFEEFDSKLARIAMSNLAVQISKALECVQRVQEEAKPEVTETRKHISVKTEPPTIIVDKMHRGDYTTITDAILAATPGSKIVIRSGVYDEGLTIDKPLEIVGECQLGDVIIRAVGKDALLFKADKGIVSNLVLKQNGGDGEWNGVDISQGCLDLIGCDIISDSLSCIHIHGNAYPRVKDNKIHDSKQGSGVFVHENGQGVLENNDIFGNARAGITIKENGDPILRGNKIRDGKAGGVFVYENGQGILENNDISGNAFSGVEITEGGNLTLKGNRIYDNKSRGVHVRDKGQGVLEDNDIFGNAFVGIEIEEGGNPTLRGNKIHDQKDDGVWIHASGQGILEDNDIFGNVDSGIRIMSDGNPAIEGNRINKNGSCGISVHHKGAGTYEDNDLRGNKLGALDISEDSKSLVKCARNLE